MNIQDLKTFDSAKYLKTDAAIAAYVDEAVASGDQFLIDYAFEVVARAKGIEPAAALKQFSAA